MTSDRYNRVQILYNGGHQPYLYGAVHIIEGPLASQRWEVPFVVSKTTSSGDEIVYGTIIRTLEQISRQLDKLIVFRTETQTRLKRAGIAVNANGEPPTSSPVAARIMDEQEELIEDVLLIVTSRIRILSEIFPHRVQAFTVPVYDNDEQVVREIQLSEIANLLLHNRYLVVRGPFVQDLMSDRKFMSPEPQTGMKIDFGDFLAKTDRLIHSLTVQDLVEMLEGAVEDLSASSSVKDIIFLHQNLVTLGGLTINRDKPEIDGPLKAVLDKVRDREFKRWVSRDQVTNDRTLHFTAAFALPSFYLEPDLDDKRIRVTMHVNGEEESLTVGYREFFADVVDAFGESKLYTSTATERSSTASGNGRKKREQGRNRKRSGRGRKGLRKKRKH